VPDILQKQRREIEVRLRQLKPLVDEYKQLQAAVSALAGVKRDGSSSRATTRATTTTRRTRATGGRRRTTRTRTPARRARSTTATRTPTRARAGATTRRRGRPRGSGTRAVQALELVRSNPGITIPQLAQRMGIKQNYLYRVLPGLQSEGKVRKDGRGWHPKG